MSSLLTYCPSDNGNNGEDAPGTPAVTVLLLEGNTNASEDRSQTGTVNVQLSATPGRAVAIPITVTGNNGATADDYQITGFDGGLNVTFAADASGPALTKTLTITATPDTETESGESITIGFGATLPDRVTASPDTATITLSDAATVIGLPPGPVTNLEATPGDTQVELEWRDSTDADFDHVTIAINPAAGSGGNDPADIEVEKDTSTQERSQTVAGLSNDVEYTFTFTAYDTENMASSPMTITATPTATDGTAPGPVSDLRAVAGDTEVTLRWLDPADSDFSHVLISRTPDPDSTGAKRVEAGVQAHTETDLTNGTAYTFTVKTVDTTGNESPGMTIAATPTAPDTTTPAEVTNEMQTAGDEQVTLTWTDPADADFSHVLISRTPDPDGTGSKRVEAGVQAHTETDLMNGTTYTFTIKTVDTTTMPMPNTSAGITIDSTPLDTTPPGEVTGLAAEAGDGEVTFHWLDPEADDLKHVLISRDGTPADTPDEIAAGVQTHTESGLTNGTEYTFTIKTVDTATPANMSSGLTAARTPMSMDSEAPGKVTGLTFTQTPTTISWSWTNPAETDLQTIRISYSGGASGTQDIDATGLHRQSQTATFMLGQRKGYTFNFVAIDNVTPTGNVGQSVVVSTPKDVDLDNDGLIEISDAAQLGLVRYDRSGDGRRQSRDLPLPDGAQMPGRAGCPTAAAAVTTMDGTNITSCIGYELANDIDFDVNGNDMADAADSHWNAGSGWERIGTTEANSYNAVFEGNGYSIRGFFVKRPSTDYVGFFGYTSDRDKVWIRNLHLELVGSALNFGIENKGFQGGEVSGILVGQNSGLVSGVSVTGNGPDAMRIHALNAGALVGINEGTIRNSYVNVGMIGVRINGPSPNGTADARVVGGLVGNNTSTGHIENCYVAGGTANPISVKEQGNLIQYGGVAGRNSGVISRCYVYKAGRVYNSAGDSVVTLPTNTNPPNTVGPVTTTQSSSAIIEHTYWDVNGLGHVNLGGFRNLQAKDPNTSGPVPTEEMLNRRILRTEAMRPPMAFGPVAFREWSTNNWNFATNSQVPALKSYKRNANGNGAQVAGDLICNQPTPRAHVACPGSTTEAVGFEAWRN